MDLTDKCSAAINLITEKISRELNITPDEVKKITITIKNGQLTVKEGKK